MKDSILTSVTLVILTNAGGFVSFLAAFFSPIYLSMFLVGMFIVCDTITGVMKAKKLNQPITSRKFSQTLSKMLFYQILIMTSHGMQLIFNDAVPIEKLALGSIGFVEFKSILENASAYLDKDVTKVLLQWLQRKQVETEESQKDPKPEN